MVGIWSSTFYQFSQIFKIVIRISQVCPKFLSFPNFSHLFLFRNFPNFFSFSNFQTFLIGSQSCIKFVQSVKNRTKISESYANFSIFPNFFQTIQISKLFWLELNLLSSLFKVFKIVRKVLNHMQISQFFQTFSKLFKFPNFFLRFGKN